MLGSRVALSAVFVLAFSLTGCAGASPETAGTAIELPALPADTLPADTLPPDPPATAAPEQSSDAGAGSPVDGLPAGEVAPRAASGAPGTAVPFGATTKDCVMVAAGVSSILLAPLSLMGVTDSDNVEQLHDQIDDLRALVPRELDEHFDELQNVVTATTRDGEEFDERAYRAAVAPIEEWLQQHCSDPSE